MRTAATTVPQATDQQATLLRYTNGAIALHWLTALLVVAQVIVGFAFANMARGPARGEVFTWHKTLGAAILVLSVIRLAWRLTHEPPPFPETLPRWERTAAVWNHRIFYFLLIALPVTGLATISAGETASVTTLLGGLPLPLIPGIPKSAHDGLGGLHVVLVFVTLALLALHVAAALKHQFADHARAAGRMPPFQAPGGEPAVPFNR